MRYWLFKSEPDTWGWPAQVTRGDVGEEWSGVRNYQARNFMREMALGDLGFFYHSQKDKAIMGVVEIIATAHPDSTAQDPAWECVDVKARFALKTPVTLDQIKGDARLSDMALLRQPRLSVQPVRAEEWDIICAMGGVKDAT